jgi:hypothetical protein
MKNNEDLFNNHRALAFGDRFFIDHLGLDEDQNNSEWFKSFYKERTPDNFVQIVIDNVNEILRRCGQTEISQSEVPDIVLINKSFGFPAFYSNLTHKIYINERFFTSAKKKIENGEDTDLALLVSIAHLFIHELLHSRSKNEIYMADKKKELKLHNYSGYQFSEMIFDHYNFPTRSRIRFLSLNEGVTDMLSMIILFRILQSGKIDLGFKFQDLKKRMFFYGDKIIENTYFPYMFLLILLSEGIAKRNGFNSKTVFKAFVNSYITGEKLTSPEMLALVKSGFKDKSMYNDFKRIYPQSEQRHVKAFMKKYFPKTTGQEILSRVFDFIENFE